MNMPFLKNDQSSEGKKLFWEDIKESVNSSYLCENKGGVGGSGWLVSDILDKTTRPEPKQLLIAEMQKAFKLLASKF